MTTLIKMDAARFVQIVESYGGSPRRWPEAERETAISFAAKYPTAQLMQTRAVSLDDSLDLLVAPPPSEFLRARILKAALTSKATVVARAANDRLPYRAIAATLVLSTVIGFMSGGMSETVMPNAVTEIASIDDLALSSFEEELTYGWIDTTAQIGDLRD